MDALAWDLSETGLNIRWKEYQSAELSSQVLLICVPNLFDREGFLEEVRYQLKEIENRLCAKGKLNTTLLSKPLHELVITWQQNKQGKGHNKAEQKLSLNDLDAFRQKGCLICTVEAAIDTWPCFGTLW